MKILINLLVAISVVVFLYAEFRNTSFWGIVVFVSGLIARQVINNWISRRIKNQDVAWAYDHAKLWAAKVHDGLNPNNCDDCKKLTP